MPRPLRITLPNLPFHVLNRGNNRQTVFREKEDFVYFVKLLKRYKKDLEFRLYHFCLMSNHTHFVIEPTIEGSLSKKRK
ncbi:transposase [Patescibacteria group bacterium]|nr:transposase [Patescibacteria group bacterium]